MFEMLKVMLNANLTDEQIAELVTDICEYSDFDNDGSVNIAEFVHFQSEDECTLLNGYPDPNLTLIPNPNPNPNPNPSHKKI